MSQNWFGKSDYPLSLQNEWFNLGHQFHKVFMIFGKFSTNSELSEFRFLTINRCHRPTVPCSVLKKHECFMNNSSRFRHPGTMMQTPQFTKASSQRSPQDWFDKSDYLHHCLMNVKISIKFS